MISLQTARKGKRMDLGLAGKTAIVTGASRGIGLAITETLIDEGAHVIAASLKGSDRLDELASAGNATVISVDLTDPAGPQRLVDAASRVDVLVNNVGGTSFRVDGFAAITDEEWISTFTLNVLSTVRTTRAAVQKLIASRGTVVNVVSVNSTLADPNVMDYCAAKAAAANFTKSLSKELGPSGVRVNSVSPGPVETDLWLGANGVAQTVARKTGGDPQDVAASAVAGTATGRFTHPQEVADVVAFLASSRAANMTGTDIRIDGGLIATT